MTDTRIDKPFEPQRRATTAELGPTGAVRVGKSERSGVRPPPVILEETEAEPKPPKWADALLARVDQSEGRFLAELAEQSKRMRNDVVTPAERKVEAAEAKAEATQMQAARIVSRWKGTATGLGVLAGLAFATCSGALLNGLSTNKQVVEVASDVAETKAAELEREHDVTRDLAVRNTARLDRMEGALDEILAELRAMKPEEHTTVVVPKPKKPRAK